MLSIIQFSDIVTNVCATNEAKGVKEVHIFLENSALLLEYQVIFTSHTTLRDEHCIYFLDYFAAKQFDMSLVNNNLAEFYAK